MDEDDVAKLSPCIWGTLDYMDCDYIANGVFSEKTNVFGFGILMQKFLAGKETCRELYDWKSLAKEKVFEFVVRIHWREKI